MAKTTRRTRTSNVVDMPRTPSASQASTQAPVVSDADIAARAYELFCARGCQHGFDLQDWFQAERELRGAATSTAA